jgi:hypothetical protein
MHVTVPNHEALSALEDDVFLVDANVQCIDVCPQHRLHNPELWVLPDRECSIHACRARKTCGVL